MLTWDRILRMTPKQRAILIRVEESRVGEEGGVRGWGAERKKKKVMKGE